MRKNLSGTKPFGRLPTNPALDLSLSREIKSLETQILTDSALMLLMSSLAAGRFYSQNGREIKLTAEEVEDAGRHAGVVIEKPPIVSYDAELKREAEPVGLASAPQRLLPVLGGERPIPCQLFFSRIFGQFHGMAALAGSQDGREACSGVSHTHSTCFVPDPGLTLRPRVACKSPWYPVTHGPGDWPVPPAYRGSDANN
jgi:hypothetical protein